MFQNAWDIKWDIFRNLEWEWKIVQGETHGSQYVYLLGNRMSLEVLALDRLIDITEEDC